MSVAWVPTLEEVAYCVPGRTVNVNLPGEDVPLHTFNSDTLPTDVQAQSKIDSACNDVVLACSLIPTALEPAAKNAAMWRAAADIELSYADRNADINVYKDLDTRARYEWELFLKAAQQQNVTSLSALPSWYMPDPVWWGDRSDI